MRKRAVALLLCLSLTGCASSGQSEFEREKRSKTQPLSYYESDNPFEVAGKSIVNGAVWTLQAAAFLALGAAYVLGATGYTPSIR